MKGLIKFIKEIYKDFTIFNSKSMYKTIRTPMMVYWLNHPDYPNQKWLMQFDKTLLMYGNTFKLTHEYYKSHLNEFETINPDYQASWLQLNV